MKYTFYRTLYSSHCVSTQITQNWAKNRNKLTVAFQKHNLKVFLEPHTFYRVIKTHLKNFQNKNRSRGFNRISILQVQNPYPAEYCRFFRITSVKCGIKLQKRS